jgi:hypothetical protein
VSIRLRPDSVPDLIDRQMFWVVMTVLVFNKAVYYEKNVNTEKIIPRIGELASLLRIVTGTTKTQEMAMFFLLPSPTRCYLLPYVLAARFWM